mmetsp:Transcript_28316/g.42539  ORF Transcript_28316/g.42539 Transcript_28316/m.42539 type:complete len:128 (+) Transcript_28316:2706-3089(+)
MPDAGLVAVPTELHVNPDKSSINPSSSFVPWRYFVALAGDAICRESVRKVRRKVMVMDATDHCCVGVGGIVGAVYRRCILTASKVEPIAIKLEINRAQYHTLRGDFKDANARGRVDDVVALAIDVEE